MVQRGVLVTVCGIVGLVSKESVNQSIYDALTVLQHRGQDAAGMVTCDERRMHMRKANGLVRDVFEHHHMRRLVGVMGIGHVRYPTAGSSTSAEAQPMYVNSPYGIALAHNGNLTNAEQLEADLYRTDLRHLNTDSDSELLLNVFAHELQQEGALLPGPEHVFAAIAGVHKRVQGAYAAVAAIVGCGIVGFRDPWGIRPLVFGSRETDSGREYMIASESAALAILGFDLERDVAPGEAVFIDAAGGFHSHLCAPAKGLSPCLFEHVYLARPDSIMDDVSIYKSRLRMGERLADQILTRFSQHDHDIDVVIPVPDTGCTAALPLAYRLGVKYREGFVKNRYIGRTFIMPGQAQRQKSVRQKLNAIELEFRDKNVLLVDDSIVRGTTSQQIVRMAREAGARKVYMAIPAPAMRFPNVYGIDMPSVQEFAAYGRTDDEIGQLIGADWLVFQELSDLIRSAAGGHTHLKTFDTSVFNGEYVTGDIDATYLERLSLKRNDRSKRVRQSQLDGDQTVIELHNHA